MLVPISTPQCLVCLTLPGRLPSGPLHLSLYRHSCLPESSPSTGRPEEAVSFPCSKPFCGSPVAWDELHIRSVGHYCGSGHPSWPHLLPLSPLLSASQPSSQAQDRSAGLGPRSQGRRALTCGRGRGGGAGAAACLPLARFSAFAAVRKSSDCRRTEIGSLSPGLLAVQPASPQYLPSTRSVTF